MDRQMKNNPKDIQWMRKAIRLAAAGAGWVNPNPMVGALLVHQEQIIGQGFHEYFGGPHAEVNAIASVPAEKEHLIPGSTLYVTLEPCHHHGKTPPCTDLIIAKKIGKVVVGMVDPNPIVSGSGIAKLRAHGISVEPGILETQARQLNEVFVKYITTGRPFVVFKTAMTLDGKIATITNASRWITGERSRKSVHLMRQQLSAVMVGVDTVIADDPLLNIRLKGQWKNPLKVVADSRLRIPAAAKLLTNDPQLVLVATTKSADPEKIKNIERMGAQVIICPEKAGKVDLSFLMQSLGTMGVDSVLLEGGSTLAFSALQKGIVDKVIAFIAPKILGGEMAPSPVGGSGIENMDEAINLQTMNIRKMGKDLMIEALIEKYQH